MFRKKIIVALLLIVVVTMSVPFTAMADEVKVEAVGQPRLVASGKILECPETLKKTNDSFEAMFVINYGIYQDEVNVIFYDDSREVMIEGENEALNDYLRDRCEKWASSDDYTAWLAGKKGVAHVADCYSNLPPKKDYSLPSAEKLAADVQAALNAKNCFSGGLGCYTTYSIVNYYHYESKESQVPSRIYQNRIAYCPTCGLMFSQDYLNEMIGEDDINSTVINPDLVGVDLREYTEEEMHEFLHNYLTNAISNIFSSEFIKELAAKHLIDLENNRLIYAVDNENRLQVYSLYGVNGRVTQNFVESHIHMVTVKFEYHGRTIANSNFKSLMERYAR